MAEMGIGQIIGGVGAGLGGFLGQRQQGAAAGQAGQIQALLAMQALAMQQQMYGEAKGMIAPYANKGMETFEFLTSLLHGGAEGIGGGGKSLISTFEPTMEQLEKTPGYKWALEQGLKSVQNSAAGKGLGFSGNAMKAGTEFAEGLASTTFQQQLQNYMGQNQQAYNMLMGPSQLGAGAASSFGGMASNFGNMMGNTIGYMGNALGGGIMGQGNANAGAWNALGGGIGALGFGMPKEWTMGNAFSGLNNVLLGGPAAVAPKVNNSSWFGELGNAALRGAQ